MTSSVAGAAAPGLRRRVADASDDLLASAYQAGAYFTSGTTGAFTLTLTPTNMITATDQMCEFDLFIRHPAPHVVNLSLTIAVTGYTAAGTVTFSLGYVQTHHIRVTLMNVNSGATKEFSAKLMTA